MLRYTITLVAGLLFSSTALADDAGTARTQELLDTFCLVKTVPAEGALSAAERTANKAAFAKLDSLFNFDTLTGNAIEPHKAQLSDAQLTTFKKQFTEMVRLMAYPNAGQAFGESENSIIGSTATSAGGHDVTVELAWEDKDLELEITFHWVDQGGTLRLVDVSFDGDSLIKDYQNQFGRILNKDGVDAFMQRLEEKHTEILEKRGGVL